MKYAVLLIPLFIAPAVASPLMHCKTNFFRGACPHTLTTDSTVAAGTIGHAPADAPGSPGSPGNPGDPGSSAHGNNGWGNGDQDAPGNSAGHNNAENNSNGKPDPRGGNK